MFKQVAQALLSDQLLRVISSHTLLKIGDQAPANATVSSTEPTQIRLYSVSPSTGHTSTRFTEGRLSLHSKISASGLDPSEYAYAPLQYPSLTLVQLSFWLSEMLQTTMRLYATQSLTRGHSLPVPTLSCTLYKTIGLTPWQ